MQITVAVERVKGNGYRARSAEPVAVSARGPTREQALSKLREKIQRRIDQGTEVVALDIGSEPHPLARFAGMYKDNPEIEEVLKIIAENRKRIDEDPTVP